MGKIFVSLALAALLLLALGCTQAVQNTGEPATATNAGQPNATGQNVQQAANPELPPPPPSG